MFFVKCSASNVIDMWAGYLVQFYHRGNYCTGRVRVMYKWMDRYLYKTNRKVQMEISLEKPYSGTYRTGRTKVHLQVT